MAGLDPEELDHGTTADDKIINRIRQGQRFVERGIANRDKIACKRFLDGSEAGVDVQHDDYYVDMAGTLPNSQEVGNVNYLAVNILTKIAAIAIGDPDWHVECKEPPQPPPMQPPMPMGAPPQMAPAGAPQGAPPGMPPPQGQMQGQPQPGMMGPPQQMPMAPPDPGPTNAELVRTFLKELWKARRWQRVTRKALFKRALSGMGCVAYLWHNDVGPVLEHVRVAELAVDPNVVDWRNLRWAARKIKLPRDEAKKAFPAVLFNSTQPDIPNMDETSALPSETVEMWVYWDKDQEAITYGSEVVKTGPNLYGRVPLLFIEGDIAPESEFSLGDYDFATGLQIQLARLSGIINNMAENGGAIGWYNPGLLDDSSKEAFANGRPQGFVGISSTAADTFGYISGEPMEQSLLEAFRLAQQGLDSVTGVSEYQRGVINQSVKFATEAAMLANQSGARGNAARIEYEQFMDDCGKAIIDLVLKFGATMVDPQSPTDMLLMEAMASVQDLQIIESSTAYKDPAAEQQTSIQLLQAVAPFIQIGLVNAVPLLQDVFRAFGKRDVQKYLNTQQPQMLPPGPPAPGMQQSGMSPQGASPTPLDAGLPQTSGMPPSQATSM